LNSKFFHDDTQSDIAQAHSISVSSLFQQGENDKKDKIKKDDMKHDDNMKNDEGTK